MVQNPPEGYQRVIPYIAYDDANAAIDFLVKAFGFEERMRMAGEDGMVMHAEVSHKDNVVMLASKHPERGFVSRNDAKGMYSFIMVYVDDVDAHYATAKAAGAEILDELKDQFYGDRTYRARDPQGHDWYFGTHIQDIAPEDMKPC